MSCQLLVMNTGIATLGSGNVTDGLKYVRSSIIQFTVSVQLQGTGYGKPCYVVLHIVSSIPGSVRVS